jgi:hypothetical protein
MVVAGLLAVFVGLWMVAQTVTTEGDRLKNKMNDVTGELEVLHFEVKALSDKVDRLQVAPAQAAAPAGDAAAAPAPAPEPLPEGKK